MASSPSYSQTSVFDKEVKILFIDLLPVENVTSTLYAAITFSYKVANSLVIKSRLRHFLT